MWQSNQCKQGTQQNQFMAFKYYSGPSSSNSQLSDIEAQLKESNIKKLQSTILDADLVKPEHFKLEPHQILWNYWTNLKGNEDFAQYDSINPADFIKAMGYVLLLEPNESNTDFKYRVYGSVVAQKFGLEMTGKWVSEFKSDQKLLSILQYTSILKHPIPVYSEHTTVYTEFKETSWSRLILPLANQNGEFDRILVGNVPVDEQVLD